VVSVAERRKCAADGQVGGHCGAGREIGERLFLSHRTAGSHLYRIFPKLELSARSQLRDALAAAGTRDEQSHDSSEIEAGARLSRLGISN
jgi:hypothetical protein